MLSLRFAWGDASDADVAALAAAAPHLQALDLEGCAQFATDLGGCEFCSRPPAASSNQGLDPVLQA